MLTARQEKILKLIVENYIPDVQAISSDALAQVLDVSPATVRNDMHAMTELGFLIQPHTSAGRIPSEKGWHYYVNNFMNAEQKIVQKDFDALESTLNKTNNNTRENIKQIAKVLAELSGTTVVVAHQPRDMYYTGLTNLLSQPEFHESQSVVHISQMIDHLDEVMMNIFNSVEDIGVSVGRENPFSPECSVVIGSLQSGDQKLIIGILGPMRMSYNYNYALLRTVRELLGE